MKTFSKISLFVIPLIAVVMLVPTTLRADTIAMTQGTPAPTLSPVLANDVNFDSLATGTLITATMFASQGIASITNNGAPLATFAGTQSLPNYLGTGPNDGWAMDTTIAFGALQNVVGFGDAGPNNTTVTLFDSLGNVLFSSTFASCSNCYWVFTDSTGTNISSMEITSSFIAIDDVQFNNVATPEPGALVLLVCGLIGIAGLLRRKTATPATSAL